MYIFQCKMVRAALVVLILALAASLGTNCGVIRQVGKTLQDVAQVLCLVTASEQPKDALGGMSAEDWCEIEENLRPFLDAALSAKQEAEGKAGFSREAEEE